MKTAVSTSVELHVLDSGQNGICEEKQSLFLNYLVVLNPQNSCDIQNKFSIILRLKCSYKYNLQIFEIFVTYVL